MRFIALALALLWALPVRAECSQDPEGSAARSASAEPYDVPAAKPCPGAAVGGLIPQQPWTESRNEMRSNVLRSGAFGVGFGALLLLSGGLMALCSKQEGSSGGFCHSAVEPLLIGGGSIALLGIGALAIGTWVVPVDEGGRAGISAGAQIRLAWDFRR